ncbi:MAG: terminase family protein, partial [Candidatus Cloacimonetes bacterium]|nr:terminase family protein [Candidatus Cloacimonadota bacterium]
MITDKNRGFKGNPKLRSPDLLIEYTDEQILEIVRCMDDFMYFCAKYVKVIDQSTSKIIPFELYPYQKKMCDVYKKNKRVIVLAPRQCGKSVFTIAYLLWVGLFNEYKNIVIVANKDATAKKTLAKLKTMYIHLPIWLKQGILEWNKKQISFENGTNIYAEATSSSGNRGDTASIVFLD